QTHDALDDRDVRIGRRPEEHLPADRWPEHPAIEITGQPTGDGRMMPGVNEGRSNLERLHPAATPFQGRQQRQRHRGFANAAMRARNDESMVVHLALSPLISKLHTGKDRSGWRAKKKHFLVVLVEQVINATE